MQRVRAAATLAGLMPCAMPSSSAPPAPSCPARSPSPRQRGGVDGFLLGLLAAVAVAAGLSMAGLPPLFGFVAKESVLEGLAAHGVAHADVWGWTPLVLMTVGSVLTFAYTWRFLWGSFAAKRDEEGAAVPVTRFHTRVTTLELAPAALLALVGLVLAFLPGPVEGIITAHTGSLPPLDPAEKPAYLALWHGWTPILALSAGVWVLGALLALVCLGVRRREGSGSIARSWGVEE